MPFKRNVLARYALEADLKSVSSATLKALFDWWGHGASWEPNEPEVKLIADADWPKEYRTYEGVLYRGIGIAVHDNKDPLPTFLKKPSSNPRKFPFESWSPGLRYPSGMNCLGWPTTYRFFYKITPKPSQIFLNLKTVWEEEDFKPHAGIHTGDPDEVLLYPTALEPKDLYLVQLLTKLDDDGLATVDDQGKDKGFKPAIEPNVLYEHRNGDLVPSNVKIREC